MVLSMKMVIRQVVLPPDEISLDGTEFNIKVPELSEPIGVSVIEDDLILDILMDEESKPDLMKIKVFGTGNPVFDTIDSGFAFVGHATIGGVTRYVFCYSRALSE